MHLYFVDRLNTFSAGDSRIKVSAQAGEFSEKQLYDRRDSFHRAKDIMKITVIPKFRGPFAAASHKIVDALSSHHLNHLHSSPSLTRIGF